MNLPPYARDLKLTLCHTCGQACAEDAHRCPRCDSVVHRRKPESLARTWALLVASLIFYIPANLLPVMYTNMFGSGSENTIMSGVVEFWESGSWDIAHWLRNWHVTSNVPSTRNFRHGTAILAMKINKASSHEPAALCP